MEVGISTVSIMPLPVGVCTEVLLGDQGGSIRADCGEGNIGDTATHFSGSDCTGTQTDLTTGGTVGTTAITTEFKHCDQAPCDYAVVKKATKAEELENKNCDEGSLQVKWPITGCQNVPGSTLQATLSGKSLEVTGCNADATQVITASSFISGGCSGGIVTTVQADADILEEYGLVNSCVVECVIHSVGPSTSAPVTPAPETSTGKLKGLVTVAVWSVIATVVLMV